MLGQSKTQALLNLIRKQGVVRSVDLRPHCIPREYLSRLHKEGVLERASRGVYYLPDTELTEHHSLAEAIKIAPRGIVCLLSALQFHELTTQSPFEVWLALDRKAHRPAGDGVPLHVVRFSGRALTVGVEEHLIEGIKVPVYSPAKTVADCFKYRNKIGLDIALAAMRDYRKGRHWKADELWKCAKICRVANVMRPYMEALA
ncbi:MAG: type IV toxin-antitoxin system AbiEi family antitoxin domain-containing protein [Chitinophagaceae bacterium]